jgi:hypothetical protein
VVLNDDPATDLIEPVKINLHRTSVNGWSDFRTNSDRRRLANFDVIPIVLGQLPGRPRLLPSNSKRVKQDRHPLDGFSIHGLSVRKFSVVGLY